MKVIQLGAQEARAQEYVRLLLSEQKDPREIPFPEEVGTWEDILLTLQTIASSGYVSGGYETSHRFVEKTLKSFIDDKPELAILFPTTTLVVEKKGGAPPLVAMTYIDDNGDEVTVNAYLDPKEGDSARSFLDEYIKFSSKWAPRGHFLFHEGAAIFLLSAIAKRRIYIPFGKGDYTSLYISFAADSSKYTKSTVLDLAEETLRACGWGWLPWGQKMTPEYLYKKASGILPDDYDSLPKEKQHDVYEQLKWAGQRCHIVDEWGGDLASMANPNSPRRTLHDMLLKWDRGVPFDSNDAITSGEKKIWRPYMPILAAFTPENFKVMISNKGNSDLWSTGLNSRIAFLTPPGDKASLAPWPDEEWVGVPSGIKDRLHAFDTLLARKGEPVPELNPIMDKKGNATGLYKIEYNVFPTNTTTIRGNVVRAYREYDNHMLVMINNQDLHIPKDLHSWYRRASAKAIRIAALLAWMENGGILELSHWIAAQTIVERWREAVHAFHEAISELEITREKKQETGLVSIATKKGGWCTMTDFQQRSGMSIEQIRKHLQALCEVGKFRRVELEQPSRGPRIEDPALYGLPIYDIPEKYMNRVKEPKKEEEVSVEK